MHLIYSNVSDAFHKVVRAIYDGTFPVSVEGSRNGDVLRLTEPLLITYERPLERVLFNAARDCNPFSLMYESLWTLAGRNDVAAIAHYTPRMRDYSDDGKTWHGAYGYRWRERWITEEEEIPPCPAFPHGATAGGARRVDQLDEVVKHLKEEPFSRRAVLTMWNVEDDLLRLPKKGVDHPCNTHLYVQQREETCGACLGTGIRERGTKFNHFKDMTGCTACGEKGSRRYLDINVCNRSNDLIWGMFNANAMVFSVLQEYIAARLGSEVGRMHTFTANAHVYQWNWKPEEWLAVYEQKGQPAYPPDGQYRHFPLVRDPEAFEAELPLIVEHFSGGVKQSDPRIDELTEPFFRKVAGPMFRTYELHRTYRETEQALRMTELIEADDWRAAARGWIERRKQRHEQRQRTAE